MTNGSDSAQKAGGTGGQSSRLAQSVEVAVFLIVLMPPLVLGAFSRRPAPFGFVLQAFRTITFEVGLVSLVLYFLWRNGEPRHRIGWTGKNLWRDVALGIALYIPLHIASGVVAALVWMIGLSGPLMRTPVYGLPHGAAQLALALVLAAVIAAAEETVFRGYLILRFATLTGRVSTGVVLSTVLFGVEHTYQGVAGMITVGMMGLIFALVYAWRRSLVAPIVMHFLTLALRIAVVGGL